MSDISYVKISCCNNSWYFKENMFEVLLKIIIYIDDV